MVVHKAQNHNLPPQPTLFIGRHSEIVDIVDLLNNPNCRLLTIVGPGGIGKTRLAIEVANQHRAGFPDGVFFIPLAPLSAFENIITSISNIIGLQLSNAGTPQEQLQSYLQNRQIMLILDNFEHLLEGADIVADILFASAHVKILVTSREVLNLQEEWVRQITGMRFPDNEAIESIESYDALQLFVERAHRIHGDFDDLECAIRICQLVGGMPLAIELATAWLKVMSCDRIIQEIQHNLDFLVTKARNIDERHRSIRAVFDQSWQLLEEDEQIVLCKLSVFHGGFELEAAEQVAGASVFILSELVEKSLVRITPSGRYELHELLRQYARQQLEAIGEIETTQDVHYLYYLDFLVQREDDIKGRKQVDAMDEIDADYENVRSAWIRAVDHKNYDALNPTLECMDWYSHLRQHFKEVEGFKLFRYARKKLVPEGGKIPHPAWGRILIRDEGNRGYSPIEESLKQLEQCLEWAIYHDDQREIAYCLNAFGSALFHRTYNHSDALRYWIDSLKIYTEQKDTHYMAWLSYRVGLCYGAMRQGNKFSEFVRRSINLMREKGDNLGYSSILVGMPTDYQNNSDFGHTDSSVDEINVDNYNEQEEHDFGMTMQYFFHGELEQAERLAITILGQALHQYTSLTRLTLKRRASIVVGLIANIDTDYGKARAIFEEQIQLLNTAIYSSSVDPTVDLGLAIAAFGLGEYATAKRHLQSGLSFAFDSQQLIATSWYLPVVSILMVHEGKPEQAVELLGLAYHHPSSTTGWLDKWQLFQQVRADLENELGAEIFASAWDRGKNSDLDEIVAQILGWLNDESASDSTPIEHANKRLIEPLTPRELEVLQLIVSGMNNQEISQELYIAVPTVKKHINRIFGKLSVNSRSKAIVRARDLHLDS